MGLDGQRPNDAGQQDGNAEKRMMVGAEVIAQANVEAWRQSVQEPPVAPQATPQSEPSPVPPAMHRPVETAAADEGLDTIEPLYREALGLIERLHRRLLDVIKDDLDRRECADINAVQALLLHTIGDNELSAGELRTRGYYLGSNVSFNLKKLVEMGFLDHRRSRSDRNTIRVMLTDKGREVRDIVQALYRNHVRTVEKVGGIDAGDFNTLIKSLHRLERFWTDQILYRL